MKSRFNGERQGHETELCQYWQSTAAFTSGEMNCVGKGHRREERAVCRSLHAAPSCYTTELNQACAKLFLYFRVISGTILQP